MAITYKSYQIKEGIPYINVYEGEEPKIENYREYVDASTPIEHLSDFNSAHKAWKASAKSYRIKDGFVEEIKELLFKFLGTPESRINDDSSVNLPLSIAERIEFEKCLKDEYDIWSPIVEYAILNPLAIKEETDEDQNELWKEANRDYNKWEHTQHGRNAQMKKFTITRKTK